MEAIFSRTSIRKFENRPVEDEKIEKLLRAAMAAPSAGNQQPWEFIVVTDPQLSSALSSVSPYAGPAAAAPLNIVILQSASSARWPEYAPQDLGAAAENILLEAVELGLGAVWLGIAPLQERIDKVKELFSLPDTVSAFAIISVGYPASAAAQIDRFDPARVYTNGY